MNTGLILGCVKVQSVKDGDNLLLISSLESDRCIEGVHVVTSPNGLCAVLCKP